MDGVDPTTTKRWADRDDFGSSLHSQTTQLAPPKQASKKPFLSGAEKTWGSKE
jgi:hypothetical protein